MNENTKYNSNDIAWLMDKVVYKAGKVDFQLDILESDLKNIGVDIYNKQLQILELRNKFLETQKIIESIKAEIKKINERNDENEK